MKGWVYVITNKAMPGLVKVGFSMQDPELRARELNHTGSPHPYVVMYEVLIDEPRQVEQKTHHLLGEMSEGKEWFRCSVEHAISFLKEAAASREISETYKQAERDEALRIARQRAEYKALREKAEQEIQNSESSVRESVNSTLKIQFPEPNFFPYWLGWSLAGMTLIGVLSTKSTDAGVLIGGVILGAVAAFFHMSHDSEKQKSSARYKEVIQKRDEVLASVRVKIEAKYGLNLGTAEQSKAADSNQNLPPWQDTLTFSDGARYVGELRDGKLNGKGTYAWPDGAKYVGEFNDDKRHGQGSYTWPDGSKYVGEWRDNKPNGQGTHYSADGTILQSGIWENNVIVGGR